MTLKEDARQAIGRRLRDSRVEMGLTQAEAARELGVDRRAVSSWECGRSMPMSGEWYLIGPLYGASLDYLVYGIRMVPAKQYGQTLREVFRSKEDDQTVF